MSKKGKVKPPKKKCCESKPKCRRCPLLMLANGTLPEGYGVRHRTLVRLDGAEPDGSKGKKEKRKKGKGKKGQGKKLARAA